MTIRNMKMRVDKVAGVPVPASHATTHDALLALRKASVDLRGDGREQWLARCITRRADPLRPVVAVMRAAVSTLGAADAITVAAAVVHVVTAILTDHLDVLTDSDDLARIGELFEGGCVVPEDLTVIRALPGPYLCAYAFGAALRDVRGLPTPGRLTRVAAPMLLRARPVAIAKITLCLYGGHWQRCRQATDGLSACGLGCGARTA